MRVFKWNAGHAVFIPEVDAEHRAIYQTAGELQRAVEGNAPPQRNLEVVRALLMTLEDHFAHEERLMQASNYSSLGWHRGQHDAARKRIRQLSDRMEAGELESVPLLLEFLSGWMRDHVSVADRMMAAYLRNYGRSHGGFAKAS